LSAGLLDFGGSEEDGVLYEAAEFFFADVMMGALAGGEILEGFVFHFQSLEVNDLEVNGAVIPNLALLQFHGERDKRRVETVWAGHPPPAAREEGEGSTVFERGLFGGDGLFLLLLGAVGHGLSLGRLLLIRFRGFITHDFLAFGFELTGPQHDSFSAGHGMVPAGRRIVNDGRGCPAMGTGAFVQTA
jgi:hypothetical protein